MKELKLRLLFLMCIAESLLLGRWLKLLLLKYNFLLTRLGTRGPFFCHVIRMRFGFHLIILVTDINHIWNGAAPIFTTNPRVSSENRALSSIKNTIISKEVEASVWMIRYFMNGSFFLLTAK